MVKSEKQLAHLKKLNSWWQGSDRQKAHLKKLLSGQHRETSYNWKGGKHLDAFGYVLICCPEHPNCNAGGYIMEHRLVMEKMIGRYLERHEVVHHIDHNKQNNNEDNLLLMTKENHARMHSKEPRSMWEKDGC